MKLKSLHIMAALIMLLGLLGACSDNEEATAEENENNAANEDVEENEPEVEVVEASLPFETLYQGLGTVQNFRFGPGADSEGVPVYSFNYVVADALFDEEGRIVNVYVDALEVATPNYDGASMPHFSGWPGTEGYNVTDHDTAEVSGVSDNTEDFIAEEVNNWQTKRDRGDTYGMNYTNDWHAQMDHYQEFMKGKTIAEIEELFEKGFDANGRPIKEDTDDAEALEKYNELSDDEKAQLSDIVSGASMSLSDAHGDMLGAIKEAYENRVEVTFDDEGVTAQEGSTGGSAEVGDLQDGEYTVDYAEFDSHGYKPTLVLTIEGGEVTAADYDELEEDGARKSEDEGYAEHMDIAPADAYAELEASAIANQTATVDVVSGATASSDTFNALLEYALTELAPNGTTSGSID